ncbi:MAG TPA: MFS transporter [Jatrophihabitans sp.]|jgi:predicted MFS family arabinose efflux permease|uniref:MFS transporter n=1 Tax=Jatrophihabitans sp. TaxID=1932789 RepID=UPI002F14A908
MGSKLTDDLTEDERPGRTGVLATWRETSGQAKALLAGVFVSKLAGFIQIFLVLFLTSRGFSSGQAGLALGLYGAGAVVGTFVGGSMSDRLSARTATVISMLGSALLIVSIIYLDQYLLLLLAVLLVSAVGQLYRPAAQSLITELTPPNRLVMVTAMYRLSLNLGTTAAPLIGVALVSVSYDLLFWAEALAALIYCLIALRFLPRGSGQADPAAETAGAEPPGAETVEAQQAGEPALDKKSRSGYLALLEDWRYVTFLFAFLLLCAVYVQYTAVLPLAIIEAGLSTWWYGAVITINGALVVTCEVVATRFVQTWPLRLTQLSGFALLAVGYSIYAIDLIPVLLIVGTLVWTLSEIIGAPTIWAYPGMVAPARLRGRYFGAMQSMYGLGSTVGPIVGILLFEHLGQQFFLWAAAVMVLATVIGRIGMRDSVEEHATEPVDEPILTEPTP